MVDSTTRTQHSGVSRLGLFLALSRTPHGLLDMTTPCFAALLWLGAFPSLKVILVGLLTVFAGYSAVYALNDLIGYGSDKKKMEEGLFQDSDSYLDGAIAAVFAVDPQPFFGLLLALFLWLFFWEIGGQNIPNDWEDLQGDKHLQAKTIPVRFGPDLSVVFIMACLVMTLAINVVLLWLTPSGLQWPSLTACLIAGVYLLLAPAYRLHKTKNRDEAIILFNRASYYPLALLVVVAIRCLL
jgi:4-hydroxybenzoate polyprenyltransferase